LGQLLALIGVAFTVFLGGFRKPKPRFEIQIWGTLHFSDASMGVAQFSIRISINKLISTLALFQFASGLLAHRPTKFGSHDQSGSARRKPAMVKVS
jgi:hypothetical protein